MIEVSEEQAPNTKQALGNAAGANEVEMPATPLEDDDANNALLKEHKIDHELQ